MKPFVTSFLLAAFLAVASSHGLSQERGGVDYGAPAEIKAIDVTSLGDGKYILTVSGSSVSVQPLRLIVVTPTPTPGPSPTPDPTPGLTDRAKAVRDICLQVQATSRDPDHEGTCAALSTLYRQLGDLLKSGRISDVATAELAIKQATDLLMTSRGPEATAAWVPVRAKISELWAVERTKGSPMASYAALLGEAADGMDACCRENYQIDPQVLALILEIVKLIISLFVK